jgi:hypothetical protein
MPGAGVVHYIIFAPLGLHHANRTMKKSTRIFRDGTHKAHA